ncbi:MAG: hypothetical protein E7062_00850 [Spirochaetaceae bacterium]|nr:hypothetical protein [Spirochaetaceae bacterium]
MIIENKPKESYCPDDEDENLVFHYQRREGLKNTAEKAQNNCNGSEPNSPRGFFKVLVQTKASRSILLILIMTFTITLITTYFVPNENQGSLQEGHFTLSAFSFEEKIYVTLKCVQKSIQEQEIIVTFQTFDKDKGLVSENKKAFIIAENNSFLRTTFIDYDILDVVAIIQGKNGTITLKKSVEKR